MTTPIFDVSRNRERKVQTAEDRGWSVSSNPGLDANRTEDWCPDRESVSGTIPEVTG